MLCILKGGGDHGSRPGVGDAEAGDLEKGKTPLPEKVVSWFTHQLWKQHLTEQEAPLCVEVMPQACSCQSLS